ncbi:hypothetical protein GCM10008015_24640 [Flavobacterium palustre]|uniref:Gylcosyl hydrolase 115 C-terminal domain-containing protein n=1 Tax=Flavobacterium palustre TaxID=1476463 RepID=A0ABQ1HNL7_9FLAO|nr:glycosyl hydrolase 115 family protein [Flavobacterium palustre]GGA82944.1 hypothetical protein GCM10008015_24640 [Flavobacterium palustre]
MNLQSRIKLYSSSLVLFLVASTFGQSIKKSDQRTPANYVLNQMEAKAFTIVANGKSTSIYVDPKDWKGVIRAAKDLGDDTRKVTGIASPVFENGKPEKNSIVVGTIGRSSIIDKLIATKKIDVSSIKGKWESFLIQTVDGQLVIAGSDKRGTIYGIYDISEKIGVSPWYFWADVPAKKAKELYIKAGKYFQDSPKVKYRGIFINDEEPSFAQWARGAYGGINSKMYATMFELLLRLKANYLWPAMWGKSFNEDDPLNPVVADEYGIVMGTSHHEPMMRSQKEYTDRKKEIGEWNFETNEKNISQFFYDGLERNKNFDNLITIGMRGEGDVAMGEGDDLKNIQTLQNVIKKQREIIQKVYNDTPENHPQVWAIFTEVQRYYDAGLKVPDDVILLFCDNNWGQIRRTYPEKEKVKNRIGGGGLYYHIDMNGGPWNDRWINTTTIPKLQEQFNLAYQSGLDKLWIVNVGDLKPKELPIDFIMHFAWNPDAIPANKTLDYTIDWASKIFGKENAVEVADIVSKYAKYNLWRKPEVQVANVFSIVNNHESDSVLQLWRAVADKADQLKSKIPADAQDAYYQLVLYPAKASAGVAEMYLASDKNMLFAKQGRVSANDFYKRTQELFEEDKKLSDYYNTIMSNGKWKNMMSDVHMEYKMWSMPKSNVIPQIKEVTPLSEPTMGVAIEGSELSWPNTTDKAILPVFDGLAKSSYYIDVYNRGLGKFEFTAKANKTWIKLSQSKGTVEKETRIEVAIDWNALADGTFDGLIEISQGNKTIPVQLNVVKTAAPKINEPYFGSLTGEFSIPSSKYNASVPGKFAKWVTLTDLGRSDASMGISPVTAPSATPESAPRLEYKVLLSKKGKATVCLGMLPTQDINPARGLRIAVALDNQTPVIIDARKGLVDTFGEYTPSNLAHSKVLKPLPPLNKDIYLNGNAKQRRSEVFDNLRWLDTELQVDEPGIHTLKVYMIDPEVVLEKIVVNPDNAHSSYFGPIPMQHNVK